MDEVNMQQLILTELFEKHYKKPHVAPWIVLYQLQAAKKLEKQGKISEQVEGKKPEEASQSKDVENSDKAAASNRDVIDPKRAQESAKKVSKSGFAQGNDHGDPQTDRKRDRTPTKKDIKKKIVWFKEPSVKQLKQERNENSFEDFAEFEKLIPMVKADPNEQPKIEDMNQVLAEKIKERYQTTDRFIRVSQ